MALPSGYTKLDYIQSSGTQYIDTGFKPNQDTRVLIDIENLSSAQTSFFGARASLNAASFTFFSLTATTGRSDYGTSKQSMSFTNTVGRYTVDQNKNVCTANGVTATGTANTFQLTNNLYLLALNQADEAAQKASGKLYSAQVYDNGTLVRDFIPCKNASGAIGLWDNVNSVFYANAGTGTFSTGKKHKVLIDGTGYEIKSGRVLIAGTGYDIKKGRTLIDATGYDIKFGTPVGELAVGTSVFMNVGGVRKEFIVVHQGNPDSSLYDASCNGTWVLMKDIYENRAYNSDAGAIAYSDSDIYDYANNDFLALLDSEIQGLIKTANLPDITYLSTSPKTTTPSKIFLLAPGELGVASPRDSSASESYNVYTDLSPNKPLSYFNNADDNKRISYYNGAAGTYNCRGGVNRYSANVSSTFTYLSMVVSDGEVFITRSASALKSLYGFRPALILPPEEAQIDSDYNIIPT